LRDSDNTLKMKYQKEDRRERQSFRCYRYNPK